MKTENNIMSPEWFTEPYPAWGIREERASGSVWVHFAYVGIVPEDPLTGKPWRAAQYHSDDCAVIEGGPCWVEKWPG